MNKTSQEPAGFFSLDMSNGVPIYRQIIRQIEYAILAGQLKTGDKLPTIRSLAVDLKINPNTIAKAYNELEIRGILVTQVGCGTFISDKKPPVEDNQRNWRIQELFSRFMTDMKGLGVEKQELIKLLNAYEYGK